MGVEGPGALARHLRLWTCHGAALVAAAALLAGGSGVALAVDASAPAQAPSGDAINQALLKKIEALEQRIKSLEAHDKQQSTTADNTSAARMQSKSGKGDVASAASTDPKTSQAQDKTGKANAASTPDKTTGDGKAIKPADDGKTTKQADDGKADKADKPADEGKTTKLGDALSGKVGDDKPILGVMDSPVTGLSFGAYGEVYFGAVQNPAAGGQWQNSFDARRLVLLPTYAITENIIFNAEIEFEHAGSGFDNDDKLHGTAEIEQLWVDFKFSDPISWRAPGIDLVPIGYINQHHEPTQFYSVLRPELYNGLIPSTWKAPATSIYGTIVDGISYQLMAAASNEDFGDSFGLRTDARTVPPFPIPYFPGVDGINALAFSNPPLGDFAQLTNSVAVTGRVDFALPQTPGLAWSISAYYSPNIEPRGAHGDLGNSLGNTSMAVFDAEFRYRIPNTWVELRGEGVWVTFGNPANLRANNDGDPTDNVGKSMYGFSGEVAVHVPMGTIIGTQWEAVPFYRYTNQNFQTAGFLGTDANAPTGQGQTQFHDVGVAVFPSPKVVLKATYQKVINKDPAGANADTFLGGVGFFF